MVTVNVVEHGWLRPSEDDVEGRLNRSSLCYICFVPDTDERFWLTSSLLFCLCLGVGLTAMGVDS